jgi:hypothetical protein
MAESIVVAALKRATDKWFSMLNINSLDSDFLAFAKISVDENDWVGLAPNFYDERVHPETLEACILEELETLMESLEVTIKFPKV